MGLTLSLRKNMKKSIVAALTMAVLLTGCTSMSSLQKPSREKSFVLDSNYTRTRYGGLPKRAWIEGLAKGKYTLAGEDAKYLYYVGQGDSVIVLSAERAEKYLQTGHITPFSERNAPQLTIAGGTGGLMLPRPESNAKPKLFYELRNTADGSVGGITGMTIVSMTEGSFGYVPFESETEFLRGLKIVEE